jgi:DNA gyrase subunit A
MERLDLSELQANYVLDLQLRRLTALAYEELVAEKKELLTTIGELKKILGSEQRQRTIVLKELGEMVDKYGFDRKTTIIGADDLPDLAELEQQETADRPDTPCVISLTASGLVGREPQGTAKSYSPSRHDVLADVLMTSLHQPVLAITAGGQLLRATAADLPEVGGRSRGKGANESFGANRGDSIVAVAAAEGDPIMVVTAQGVAKRIERSALAELRTGKTVIKLAKSDRVVAAFEVSDADEVVFVTSDAQALRLAASTISEQGPAAKGVAGMSLRGTAKVIAAGAVVPDAVIVTITDRGTAKATSADELPVKGRGTGGLRLTKFNDEQRIDYAWVGNPGRVMCVVGQVGAATKPNNTPQPLSLRPTRRDGASKPTAARILSVGPLRW